MYNAQRIPPYPKQVVPKPEIESIRIVDIKRKEIDLTGYGKEIYIEIRTQNAENCTIGITVKNKDWTEEEKTLGESHPVLFVRVPERAAGATICFTPLAEWLKDMEEHTEKMVVKIKLFSSYRYSYYAGWGGKLNEVDSKESKEIEIIPIVIAPWMEIAFAEDGVDENTTDGFNRVKEYYKDGAGQKGLHPIKNPWCASFVNWVLVETNRVKGTNYSFIPLNSTINNPAMAVNFVYENRYPGKVVVPPDKKPPYGAILVFHNSSIRQGHATFVIDYKKTVDGFEVTGYGGNQSNKVQTSIYSFKKQGADYYYQTKAGVKFKHRGYALPKEYKYSEEIEEYYEYNKNKNASIAGSIR